MPVKRSKPIKSGIPSRLMPAQFSALLKQPRTTIRDGLIQAEQGDDGKYDTTEGLRSIYGVQIAKASRSTNTEARNRREMADAESSEIKAAQARNELMLRADNSAIWRDGFVKIIQAIKSASYIPPQQRDKLVKTLREIEVDEPE